MPNNNPQNDASIVFLLGTSTAGKSSICNEIERQSDANSAIKGKVESWGYDQQSDVLFDKCGLALFEDNNHFSAITAKIDNQHDVLSAIFSGSFTDSQTGKYLPLDEEGFNASLNQFLEDTKNRFDVDTMLLLQEMAKQEIQTGTFDTAIKKLFKETSSREISEDAIAHAVKNSKIGISTILDGVPFPTELDMLETMEQDLTDQGFTGSYHVALIHLHPNEMAVRMEKRNRDAESEGGDKSNRRDGLRYYEGQYGQLFGKVTEAGTLLDPAQEIHQDSIYNIAEQFGNIDGDRDKPKIRDVKKDALNEEFTIDQRNEAAIKATLAIREEGEKILEAIGFEDGETSLSIGTKIKTDIVLDHQQESTSEISAKIIGFITQNMETVRANSAENIADRKDAPEVAEFLSDKPSPTPAPNTAQNVVSNITTQQTTVETWTQNIAESKSNALENVGGKY